MYKQACKVTWIHASVLFAQDLYAGSAILGSGSSDRGLSEVAASEVAGLWSRHRFVSGLRLMISPVRVSLQPRLEDGSIATQTAPLE